MSGCPGGRVTGHGSGGCDLGGGAGVPAHLGGRGAGAAPARSVAVLSPARRRGDPRARKGFNILSLRFLRVSALRLGMVPVREGAARAQPTSQGARKSLAPRWTKIGKEKLTTP